MVKLVLPFFEIHYVAAHGFAMLHLLALRFFLFFFVLLLFFFTFILLFCERSLTRPYSIHHVTADFLEDYNPIPISTMCLRAVESRNHLDYAAGIPKRLVPVYQQKTNTCRRHIKYTLLSTYVTLGDEQPTAKEHIYKHAKTQKKKHEMKKKR